MTARNTTAHDVVKVELRNEITAERVSVAVTIEPGASRTFPDMPEGDYSWILTDTRGFESWAGNWTLGSNGIDVFFTTGDFWDPDLRHVEDARCRNDLPRGWDNATPGHMPDTCASSPFGIPLFDFDRGWRLHIVNATSREIVRVGIFEEQTGDFDHWEIHVFPGGEFSSRGLRAGGSNTYQIGFESENGELTLAWILSPPDVAEDQIIAVADEDFNLRDMVLMSGSTLVEAWNSIGLFGTVFAHGG